MATSLHRRPEASAKQIAAKRSALLNMLHSSEHRESVPERDYGEHDPRIAPFPACTCGSPGRLTKLDTGRWFAECSACDRAIREAQTYDWAACLNWCELNLDGLDYRQLSLFDLSGLSPQEAKQRMVPIYNDLLLKSQIATLDLALNQRNREHTAPGRDYIERMHAYRDWAKLALRLIKNAGQSTITSEAKL